MRKGMWRWLIFHRPRSKKDDGDVAAYHGRCNEPGGFKATRNKYSGKPGLSTELAQAPL